MIPRFRTSTLFMGVFVTAILVLWWKDHHNLTKELAQYRSTNVRGTWDVAEVLGKPDTHQAGDIPTAWASATQDSQREWLLVEYRKAVRPTSLAIYETYNPGAVDKVTAFRPDGAEVTVWQGADPTPVGSSRGVSVIPLQMNFKCKRMRIHLNSPAVAGWNEIDAVGLRSRWWGRTQWAVSATASSSYPNRHGVVLSGKAFSLK